MRTPDSFLTRPVVALWTPRVMGPGLFPTRSSLHSGT